MKKKELPALYTVFYSQETQGPGAPSIIHTLHVECIEKHKSASLESRPHLQALNMSKGSPYCKVWLNALLI